MNVQSLKTDIQQVLDSDIALRKEFNELKRSLSDYRNQLIMRDEDCKRLQVTIDVLNTKLSVMERDNTNYKAELAAFKELRGTIKDQLNTKQSEIDARLAEIEELKNEVASIASVYEQKIESIKNEASIELETVKQEYILQINDLRSNSHYKESGIKEEFENRVNELTANLADREQTLTLRHQEEVLAIKSSYEEKITFLNNDYGSQISRLTSSSESEISSLKQSHATAIANLEESYSTKIDAIKYSYQNEISSLKLQLEEQRNTLSGDMRSQLDALAAEYSAKEQQLISSYESQLEELRSLSSVSNQELTATFQNEISSLKASHESLIAELNSGNEALVQQITSSYEEKLSNTLIHSNTQNSKLADELSKAQLENDHYKEKVRELVYHVDAQNTQLEALNSQIGHIESLWKSETAKLNEVNLEFENFRQTSSLSSTEQVNQLNSQIESLNSELENLGLLFESTTNTLSETEGKLESTTLELENSMETIQHLYSQLNNWQATASEKEQSFESFKSELEISTAQQLENKDIEFKKLLSENTNLINEIDMAQDKVEAQEAEINLLKTELDELNAVNTARVEELKETLSAKNFRITNLEGTNAGLEQEIASLKAEVASLKSELESSSQSSEQFNALQHNFDSLATEKHNLISEINLLQGTIGDLNSSVSELNNKISGYEHELELLKNSSNTEEQEAFIDRLFKQIDILNDERLALLTEKEQMANQLLKMNDVISGLSQNIESQNIDVTDLNNHRKNVILASNSGGSNEKNHMKKQINELVREIDKCIALLSA